MQSLRTWITQQQADLTHWLQYLVEINTYTANVQGVDAGMDALCRLAENLGLTAETVQGRHRLIRSGGNAGPRILLVAHMDTVHPPDDDFQHYEPQADGYIRGPGIGDIKGGLLMGLWTVKALQMLHPQADVCLVVSADEEIGSPTIQPWYLQGLHGAHYAIGLEPGFPQGPLQPSVTMGFVEQRKGCGRVHFTVRGQAATRVGPGSRA
ncbi:MAG: M20 family metallopeptidase [Anaerolineae bacterium]|nr:M20 family metallopeptidase [Anaerolineae bacterium]